MKSTSENRGRAGSLVEMDIVGTALQVHTLTQGISPFDERAGAAELQTSRFTSRSRPFSTIVSENDERGARTVNVRIMSSMTDTHFMIRF